MLVLDGVFVPASAEVDGPLRFLPAPPPTTHDLHRVVTAVRNGVARWLGKRRPPEDEPSDLDTLGGCARLAVQPGLFDRIGGAPQLGADDPDHDVARSSSTSASVDGWNLHAAVRIGANDDVSREKLVRYCARPAFAVERLRVLPDGRVAYALKQPHKGATHRILTPLELLARIAALIPPPRVPFLRYHGVLAPASKWRSRVVPIAIMNPSRRDASRTPTQPGTTRTQADAGSASPTHGAGRSQRHYCGGLRSGAATDHELLSNLLANGCADDARAAAPTSVRPRPQWSADVRSPSLGAHQALAEAHRGRLADGALFASSPRIDWARLLRRTFGFDVLVCPSCGNAARLIAEITEPTAIADILRHLRHAPTRAPPAGAHDAELCGDDPSEPLFDAEALA